MTKREIAELRQLNDVDPAEIVEIISREPRILPRLQAILARVKGIK